MPSAGERMGLRGAAGVACAVAVAAVALLAMAGGLAPGGSARAQVDLQLFDTPPRPRSFAIVDAAAFLPPRRARRGLVRVAPFRALYSASLGADPQSFLQKAPEQGHPGMFRSPRPSRPPPCDTLLNAHTRATKGSEGEREEKETVRGGERCADASVVAACADSVWLCAGVVGAQSTLCREAL